MNTKNIKYASIAVVAIMGFASCDDFLDRPTEDAFTASSYYQTDAQLHSTSATIYNSPWYDFQRGFFKVGEVMAGNYYWGSSPYLTFTVNGTDEDLVNMSASLWSVNAYANVLVKNVNEIAGPGTTEAVRNEVKGEALVWKAMAYFYLVRTFGGVPIIHDNTSMIAAGNYNDVYRATPENVYDYIILTLKQAIEWLPSKPSDAGRLDKYCAKGLLAKVYLTKAGVTGTLNKEDLQNAVAYAKDVRDNSGRALEPEFWRIFRLSGNTCDESLIAWRWTAATTAGGNWTRQNTFQSDLGITGFSEFGDIWGEWASPSVDLIEAFGDSPLREERYNTDTRRKSTCMLPNDVYDYFWADHSETFAKGGFEVLDFCYNTDEATLKSRNSLSGNPAFQTGAHNVKHLVGDKYDHNEGPYGCGVSMQRMATSLATHLLRLADVYLVLAEAQSLIDGGTTSNADAVAAYNDVHTRACPLANQVSSVSWETIWKERRLELALEGDRWYDFVRLAYYNPDRALAELSAQKRGTYNGLADAYKTYFESGYSSWNTSSCTYDKGAEATFSKSIFSIPFPDTDKLTNPHLSEEPVNQDVSQYTY
ncbi:MAG: RagB/SusD family nutrient uptake outer membrane protein [Bacteroidales bacterium]|nr:RagB/SusD family nutrient uptake outer membrane protein [Bacteroidales bacterium]